MSGRRRESDDASATRSAILDAVEKIMSEEGYAAVTSRRVGRDAGLKSLLVHYYFSTMDDMFIALYKRKSEQHTFLLEEVMASDRPLHALWNLFMAEGGPRITSEFMALAKHRTALSVEIARVGEANRKTHAEIVKRAVNKRNVVFEDIPPIALAMLLSSAANLIHLEFPIGLLAGHDEMEAALQQLVDRLEP